MHYIHITYILHTYYIHITYQMAGIDLFNGLVDELDDISKIITDGKYLSLMNKLSAIRLQYIKDIACIDTCDCIPGGNIFCVDNFAKFIICKNLDYILEEVPILHNLIILKGLPNSTYEFLNDPNQITNESIETNETFIKITNHFIPCKIHFEPINVDTKYIHDSIEGIKIQKIINILISFMHNISGNFRQILIGIAIFDYNFKHFGFMMEPNRYKYLEASYNKLYELTESVDIEASKSLYILIIKKICNIHENPFNLFQQNMTPYYSHAFNIEQNRLQLVFVNAVQAFTDSVNAEHPDNVDTAEHPDNVDTAEHPDNVDNTEILLEYYKNYIIIPDEDGILSNEDIRWNDHVMLLAQVGDSITEQDLILLHPDPQYRSITRDETIISNRILNRFYD